MKVTLAEQYDVYLSNMLGGMHDLCADSLGVSPDSVKAMGVGYLPGEQAWIFPERNAKGEVTGLMRRYVNGRKLCVSGTKHGLYFVYNQNSDTTQKRYAPGKHNWMRVDDALYPCKDKGCPVCGRKKYCMVSREDPIDPAAVLCTKQKKGSRKFRESSAAWLHILDENRNLCGSYAPVVKFTDDDGPILCVEGSSDVLAALTLGFDAIGRFSNVGGLDILKQMPITGRPLWVMGENDLKSNGDWPGKDGVERTYLSMRGMCKCVRVMPPDGVKDLRTWLQRGLTKDELTSYVEKHGDSSDDLGPDILADDIAANIARRFIEDEHRQGDIVTLRSYHGGWCRWNGHCYKEIQPDIIRGELYAFLDGKHFVQTDGQGNDKVVPYKATRNKINDLLDAFSQWCPVYHDPPAWLHNTDLPDPKDLIMFKNGMLDVNAYTEGNIVMYDPDPSMFTLTCCPYDFDEDATSEFAEQFLLDTYNGDELAVALVWEWLGYQLTSDMSMEKMMLLYGEPRSGKGTILDMMRATIGFDMCCSGLFKGITGQFGLETFIGKLACIFDDVRNPNRATLDEALEIILQIVGNGSVYVNKKTVRALPQVNLKTRFTMAMNEIPSFVDHSRALESRLLVLYHPNSHVDDPDPTIKTRILEEARDGRMINFALQGLKRLRNNGEFSVPEAHKLVMDQFKALATPVSTFLDDCCELNTEGCDEDFMTPKNDVFAAWCGWCKRNIRKPGLPEQFSKWLMGHAPMIKTARRRTDEGRKWFYTNIQLNGNAQQFLE